jgi:hypothetical protein
MAGRRVKKRRGTPMGPVYGVPERCLRSKTNAGIMPAFQAESLLHDL